MPRPVIVLAEPEPRQGLSTRKLVLETAKFNVLTAHSSTEGTEICEASPSLAALVVTADLKSVDKLVTTVKKSRPSLLVICMSPNRNAELKGVDHYVSSYEPDQLVELCRELFGDPRKIKY